MSKGLTVDGMAERKTGPEVELSPAARSVRGKFGPRKATYMSGGIGVVSGGAGTDKSVAIHGRITVANSGEMRAALATALRTKPAKVSVDLSDASYIDTSGLATLIEAARIARGQGTRMILRGIHDQPRYFLEISHLDRLFDIAAQEAAT